MDPMKKCCYQSLDIYSLATHGRKISSIKFCLHMEAPGQHISSYWFQIFSLKGNIIYLAWMSQGANICEILRSAKCYLPWNLLLDWQIFF